RLQRAPQDVDGAVEVVGPGLLVQLWPEQVDQPLPGNALAIVRDQVLEQRLGLAIAEGFVDEGMLALLDAEKPESVQAQHGLLLAALLLGLLLAAVEPHLHPD